MATVLNLDFATHTNAAGFRRDFNAVADNLARANFNAMIFQIRPGCDAFYPSAENPWSRYLSGAEGRGIPGFDPLEFMVAAAHRKGLEFHAWLNPYPGGLQYLDAQSGLSEHPLHRRTSPGVTPTRCWR